MHTPVTTRSSGARGRRRVDDQQQRVGGGADGGGQREQAARIDPVGESEERAREAAEHEARLHAARQRRLGEAGQPEFARRAPGTTADAENHSAIAATWQTAMIATDAAFDRALHQHRGGLGRRGAAIRSSAA